MIMRRLKEMALGRITRHADPVRRSHDDLGKYQFFFIRGHMRSGTNWVGNLLNMHPKINCNGEYYFDMVRAELDKMINTSYTLLNRESIGNLALRCFEDLVKKCIIEGAQLSYKKDVLWFGDRTPRPLEPILIEGAPHFLVVRDGRDILVSWAYHLHRINIANHPFESYPGMQAKKALFEKNNLYFKENPAELLDDEAWVRQSARDWVLRMRLCLATMDKIEKGQLNASVHVVKYEELHRDVEIGRREMYRFLGLDPTEAKPLNRLTKPSFQREDLDSHYRKGVIGDWKNYFTADVSRWFREEAGEMLVNLGYEKDRAWTNEVF